MTKNFKVGSTAVALVIVAGLIGLYSYLNSKIGDLEREKLRLEREIVTMDAEKDSILGLGAYVITDTLWGDSIPVPYAVHDTLPPITIYVPIPWVRGHITIDTFKTFGPDYDPLSVKITGKFHFPEQEPDTNWLKIVPSFKKAPYVPPDIKTYPTKSIGFVMAFNSNSELMGLAEFRYKRFSVYGGYSIPGKYYLTGMGLRLIGW